MPPLDQLYLKDENKDKTDIIEVKWKILAFIMSLNDGVIAKMKKLPKEYLLISAILYSLVKVCLLKYRLIL